MGEKGKRELGDDKPCAGADALGGGGS